MHRDRARAGKPAGLGNLNPRQGSAFPHLTTDGAGSIPAEDTDPVQGYLGGFARWYRQLPAKQSTAGNRPRGFESRILRLTQHDEGCPEGTRSAVGSGVGTSQALRGSNPLPFAVLFTRRRRRAGAAAALKAVGFTAHGGSIPLVSAHCSCNRAHRRHGAPTVSMIAAIIMVMSYVCHGSLVDFPQIGDGTCCAGAAMLGPERCTCWEAIHDLEQQPPDQEKVRWLAAGVEPVTRDSMCGDCAYRPDSPERRGDPSYLGNAEDLERMAAYDRFWCHQGMRRRIAWRHPSGAVFEKDHPGSYDPPIIGGIPYRVDGSPGELCAGWDARRRAIAAARARLDQADDATPRSA